MWKPDRFALETINYLKEKKCGNLTGLQFPAQIKSVFCQTSPFLFSFLGNIDYANIKTMLNIDNAMLTINYSNIKTVLTIDYGNIRTMETSKERES